GEGRVAEHPRGKSARGSSWKQEGVALLWGARDERAGGEGSRGLGSGKVEECEQRRGAGEAGGGVAGAVENRTRGGSRWFAGCGAASTAAFIDWTAALGGDADGDGASE